MKQVKRPLLAAGNNTGLKLLLHYQTFGLMYSLWCDQKMMVEAEWSKKSGKGEGVKSYKQQEEGELKIEMTEGGGHHVTNDAQRAKSMTGGVQVMMWPWVTNSGGGGVHLLSTAGEREKEMERGRGMQHGRQVERKREKDRGSEQGRRMKTKKEETDPDKAKR